MNNLKHIEINIGKACNNKCRFCMSSKPELWDIKFVKLEDLKIKLSNYYKDGYRSIGFLGGDISIHPNLNEIIKYCKDLGFIEIQAITNGMVFDYFSKAEKIVNSGLTRVNFSIHSHISEVEDYLTGVPGGLSRKLKAIDNFNLLHKKGLLKYPISINIVLNKHNLKDILKTVLYFYKIKKINDIRINFIWLSEDVEENWDDLKISYTEFLPYLKEIVFISLKLNIRLTFDTVPYCIFYKISKNFNLLKKFFGEEQDHIVEIDWINNKEKFNWSERKKNELKTQFKNCKKCILRDNCQGVWKEYGKLYGGEEFLPILEIND